MHGKSCAYVCNEDGGILCYKCGQETVSTDEKTNDATASCRRQSTYALCLSFVVLLYENITTPLSFLP